MINIERLLLVLVISIVLMSVVTVSFYLCRVRSVFYYLIMPAMTFGTGYAVAWAYGVTSQDVALIVSAACGLIGVQGAWVITTRIPPP